MREVVDLNARVADEFPSLSEQGAALIRAAQAYTREVETVARKLIDQGASSRDFSYLDPADYDAAARTASFESLATVGEALIFDVGAVPVSPAQIIEALAAYRPRSTARRRPSQPARSAEADPLARWEQQREAERIRIERDAELFLQGAESIELTDRLRATAWEGVRRTLAQLLTIHQHVAPRFRVDLADSVLVDPAAEASYFTPTTLRRLVAAGDGGQDRVGALLEGEDAV